MAVAHLEHAGDHEQPRQVLARVRVVLAFRPLPDVHHILDQQRMQVVLHGERPQHVHVGQPVDVIQRTTAHSGRWSEKIVEVAHLLDLNAIGRKVGASDRDLGTLSLRLRQLVMLDPRGAPGCCK